MASTSNKQWYFIYNGGSIMAYLYVNPDGITRPYSTITDAITSASGGDTIVLDPGTYMEQVSLTKELNIRGNTQTPENDDIIISAGTYPLHLSRVLTNTETIHIEGVTLWATNLANFSGHIFKLLAGQSASQYTNLIFNRCRFVSTYNGVNQLAMGFEATYADKLWYDHCEWAMEAANPKYEFDKAYFGPIATNRINNSRVIACVYQDAFQNYQGQNAPTIHNYVTTPTEGYGPAYSSDWYVPLDYPVVGYFDGYVMEEGSPVQRTINLYKRTNGEFLSTTSSNPSGYYYIETTFSGMHYVMCLDAPADPLYNDLIIGSAYPTAI